MKADSYKKAFVVFVGCLELLKGLGGVYYFLSSKVYDVNYLLFCVGLAISVFKIMIASGLLAFRDWARKAFVVLLIVLSLCAEYFLFKNGCREQFNALIALMIPPAIFLAYLFTRKSIKSLFQS